ncbi:uncharacterized protein LOC143017116 isoform X2 [Genypterus blacodes]|uniref:uncharacterized protein LOC143017116 isoform X2 n=1 Tax=Genypterus blacodes TaxID=154954 RepID=UPI003F76A42A
MSSRVLLLLLAALTAARLRLGSAEGDPLPASLIDLVRNSAISSVDDLKVLLQQETDAIEEEEEDEHDALPKHAHARYARSLEAQPAQQAVCKVRTEVMEVTRAMLDRRNANFMLWPPCVEVQRCSGCCNTRLLQCVPTFTSTRYLQVIKIQYINKKAHYDKAVISVEDHVTCRCQAPSSSSPSSSSSSVTVPRTPVQASTNPAPPPAQQPPPAPHLPLPRTVHPTQPKTHASKADLHRHDDLKHNQHHYHSEDPAARQWQQGRYTQLVHWTQPRVHQTPPHTQAGAQPQTHPVIGVLGSVSSWPSEVRAEHSLMGSPHQGPREGGHGSGYEGNREESGVREVHQADGTHRRQQPHQQRNHDPSTEEHELRTQYRLNAPQSDSAVPPGHPTQPPNQQPEQTPKTPTAPAHHRDSAAESVSDNSRRNTDVTNHKQTETVTANHRDRNEREESGSANSWDAAGAQPANGKKGKDSKVEEERRQRGSEGDQPSHLHPRHPQQRPKPTALRTVLPTVVPSSPSPHRAPFRSASARRKRRRRNRISKAAIRAMIM